MIAGLTSLLHVLARAVDGPWTDVFVFVFACLSVVVWVENVKGALRLRRQRRMAEYRKED
jgi:hypothetical protein